MCCLFGIHNYKQNLNQNQMNHILSVLSKESEARGTDVTGIAYAAEDVDTMINEGILPEEIEAYFYQIDLDRYF